MQELNIPFCVNVNCFVVHKLIIALLQTKFPAVVQLVSQAEQKLFLFDSTDRCHTPPLPRRYPKLRCPKSQASVHSLFFPKSF